jgi:tripartite-type tricarboxylate transporter receptor subunit TctC
MAPPGTPDDIVAKLNDALNKATPPVREMVIKNGLTPMSQSPAEAKQFIMDAMAAN